MSKVLIHAQKNSICNSLSIATPIWKYPCSVVLMNDPCTHSSRMLDFMLLIDDISQGYIICYVGFLSLFVSLQVVLNRRKEFQWKRLSLFLRVGATRYTIYIFSTLLIANNVCRLYFNFCLQL